LIYVDGESVAVLFDQDYGWGFWDHDHRWHHAPDRWRSRLEEKFPHGEGVHRHPDTFVRQQNEALRSASAARGGAMGGGARPPGAAGGMGGAARPPAMAAGRPGSSFTGAVRAGPTNSASSFVASHMSREAVATRAGGGFGAFGGGHAGGGGIGGGMRGGGGGMARVSAPSGGGGKRGK
jgi:hypothetical protein